jgi:hypothetical protein
MVTCATTLLISLYWKLVPESHDNDDIVPAFAVRDLPGRGKGLIAIRDIRVGTIPGTIPGV